MSYVTRPALFADLHDRIGVALNIVHRGQSVITRVRVRDFFKGIGGGGVCLNIEFCGIRIVRSNKLDRFHASIGLNAQGCSCTRVFTVEGDGLGAVVSQQPAIVGDDP